MNPSGYRARRATVDDLPRLRLLWQQAQFPLERLEKRVTEFQLVETPEGILLGAIGLQLAAPQGGIHHEAFAKPEEAERMRPLLWERLDGVARNHGLSRLWVAQDRSFWRARGFGEASEELIKKRPAQLEFLLGGALTLQLKDEAAASISFEKEFELFRQTQKAETERALRHARHLRVVAVLVSFVAMVIVIAAVWYLMKKVPLLPTH